MFYVNLCRPVANGLDNLYAATSPRANGPHPKLYELYGSSNLAIPKYQTDDNALTFGPRFNAGKYIFKICLLGTKATQFFILSALKKVHSTDIYAYVATVFAV